MHKKLKLLFLGLMVCLLTGCMKMNIYTEVKSDKTMKMNIEYLIDETTFQGSEITAQDWLNEMKDNYLKDKQKDMTFQPIDKTIDGKKWVGFKITTDDQKQSKYLTEKDIDGTKSIVFTIPMNQVSHQLGNSLGGVPQNSSLDDLKAKGVEMNLTVKMPAKASSNIGTVDGIRSISQWIGWRYCDFISSFWWYRYDIDFYWFRDCIDCCDCSGVDEEKESTNQ